MTCSYVMNILYRAALHKQPQGTLDEFIFGTQSQCNIKFIAKMHASI